MEPKCWSDLWLLVHFIPEVSLTIVLRQQRAKEANYALVWRGTFFIYSHLNFLQLLGAMNAIWRSIHPSIHPHKPNYHLINQKCPLIGCAVSVHKTVYIHPTICTNMNIIFLLQYLAAEPISRRWSTAQLHWRKAAYCLALLAYANVSLGKM